MLFSLARMLGGSHILGCLEVRSEHDSGHKCACNGGSGVRACCTTELFPHVAGLFLCLVVGTKIKRFVNSESNENQCTIEA